MRLGPKALVGLGLPAALRPHAPKKGVGANLLPGESALLLETGDYLLLENGSILLLEA